MNDNSVLNFIRHCIEDVASGLVRENDEAFRIAKYAKALILYSDWNGAFCIDEWGRIFQTEWDDLDKKNYDLESRVKNMVLFQGTRNYPELAHLLPSRAATDNICPFCNGTGVATLPDGATADFLVCYCGGLGWIPNEISPESS